MRAGCHPQIGFMCYVLDLATSARHTPEAKPKCSPQQSHKISHRILAVTSPEHDIHLQPQPSPWQSVLVQMCVPGWGQSAHRVAAGFDVASPPRLTASSPRATTRLIARAGATRLIPRLPPGGLWSARGRPAPSWVCPPPPPGLPWPGAAALPARRL